MLICTGCVSVWRRERERESLVWNGFVILWENGCWIPYDSRIETLIQHFLPLNITTLHWQLSHAILIILHLFVMICSFWYRRFTQCCKSHLGGWCGTFCALISMVLVKMLFLLAVEDSWPNLSQNFGQRFYLFRFLVSLIFKLGVEWWWISVCSCNGRNEADTKPVYNNILQAPWCLRAMCHNFVTCYSFNFWLIHLSFAFCYFEVSFFFHKIIEIRCLFFH